jgi:hypothetical protein
LRISLTDDTVNDSVAFDPPNGETLVVLTDTPLLRLQPNNAAESVQVCE